MTILLMLLAMVVPMITTAVPVGAAAASPTADPPRVPHYFGPWPNWANSPLTLSTASVTFEGAGSGATAVAQVDPTSPNGIAGIDITSPGGGLRRLHDGDGRRWGARRPPPAVTVSTSDVVTGFTDVQAGGGYTAFTVALAGGGGSGATAIASGGVDAVDVTDAGSGYAMPTVDFDYPDDPNGIQATGHVECVETTDCTHAPDATVSIDKVVVDEPGSGYTTAPAVTIRNGTQYDPINFPEGTGAGDGHGHALAHGGQCCGLRRRLHQRPRCDGHRPGRRFRFFWCSARVR